jgi:hypothetical protein
MPSTADIRGSVPLLLSERRLCRHVGLPRSTGAVHRPRHRQLRDLGSLYRAGHLGSRGEGAGTASLLRRGDCHTAGRIFASSRRGAALDTLLATKVLLGHRAALAISVGPFHDGDSWRALLTGMAGGRNGGPERGPSHPSRKRPAVDAHDLDHDADHDRFGRPDLCRPGHADALGFEARANVAECARVRPRLRGSGAPFFEVRRVVLRLAAVAWSAGARSSPDWPERGVPRAIEGLEGSKVRAPRWRDDGRDAIPL